MSDSSRNRSTKGARTLFAMVLLGVSGLAAATVPAPTITATSPDSYSVSYTPCAQCFAHGLEEKAGAGGEWEYVGSETLRYSARAPGTYSYRVVYAQVSPTMQYELAYSSARSIVIESESASSGEAGLETQLEQEYDAFRADLDNDGRDELLIERRLAGESIAGMPAAVLIRRDSAGAAGAAVVDAALLRRQALWYPADIEIVTRDVNVDGFADLVIRGVAADDGAVLDSNQIVFGSESGSPGATLRMRGVDDGLVRFSRDINRHLIDPEYYPTHAPLRYVRVVYYSMNCLDYSSSAGIDGWLGSVLPWPCIVQPNYYYIVYRDYSVFDDDAMFVASYDYGMLHGVVPKDSALELIRIVLARVIGISIGGWEITDLLGRNDPPLDAVERSGIDLFVVLAGISDAVAQQGEGTGETTEAQGTATTDRVLIKGRRVLGGGPMHSVLEFRNSTISAYDSDPSIWIDGRLVSQRDWPRDHPALTMRLGYVDGPVDAASYWTGLVRADARYDDDLPYDLFPSIGQGGYNSNSFTAGLIAATLGRPTISMSTLIGGERPVPPSAFD